MITKSSPRKGGVGSKITTGSHHFLDSSTAISTNIGNAARNGVSAAKMSDYMLH